MDVYNGEATILNRDDLFAFKHAEGISFHHHAGRSFIRLYLERHGDQPATYTKREQVLFPRTRETASRYREIDTNASVYGYASNGDTWNQANGGESAEAFYYFVNTPPHVQSLTETLRAGDTLTLQWMASANSEAITAVGFDRDTLELAIERPGKRLVYLMAVQVGPDNSARMIQRAGRVAIRL